MKKLLIATAAMAVVAGAQAQSSVTVYGLIDQGYAALDYQNVAGTTTSAAQRQVNGLNPGNSKAGAMASQRIGFKGVEDLGGGLKATFNYELGLSGAPAGNDAAGNGTLGTTPRISTVALESAKYGTVKLGYDTTGLHSTVAGHRAISGSNFVGDLAYYTDDVSGADQRIHEKAVRMSGVSYTTPTISGVNVRVDYGNDRDRTDSGATDAKYQNTGVTVNYVTGPLALAATTHNYIIRTLTADDTLNYKYSAVSGKYSVTPNLTVDALYAKAKKENKSFVQQQKDDVQQIGIKYTAGNLAYAAQYGNGNGETTSAAESRDRKGYQLAVINSLSKRTDLYAMYGQQQIKYTASATSALVGVREKLTGFVVGVKHAF